MRHRRVFMLNKCDSNNLGAAILAFLCVLSYFGFSSTYHSYKHNWARHKNGLMRLTNKMSNLKIWKKIQDMT